MMVWCPMGSLRPASPPRTWRHRLVALLAAAHDAVAR